MLRRSIGAVLRACTVPSIHAQPAERVELDAEVTQSLERFRSSCKAPAAQLVIAWDALQPAFSPDENTPYNEHIVQSQVRDILIALADGCANGMAVVDLVVAKKADKTAAKFERPPRPVFATMVKGRYDVSVLEEELQFLDIALSLMPGE